MKKGYKRLLIFTLLILLFLLFNSFIYNILNKYFMIIFLLIILVIFQVMFGFEKDRRRYTKDIILEIIIFLLAFFFLYYILGIKISFVRIENYYTINGLINFIIPITITTIVAEILRYQLLIKAEGSFKLIVLITILLIAIDITNPIYYNNSTNKYGVFLLIALTILPSITKNITCTYISTKVGYKATLVYLLPMQLYAYLIPIIPNTSEYLESLIRFLVPAFLLFKILTFFKKEKDEEIKVENNKKNYILLGIMSLVVMIFFYFTSGYFHHQGIAIASNSMSPKIKKGDIVIIEKINNNYDNLQEGQIIAYKYNNKIIVHRLTDKVTANNKYYFYTKGDANQDRDNYEIKEEMLIGVVKTKIPIIGWLAVWLNTT